MDPISRPPHIVLANSVRLLAGAERFVLDIAAGLRNRGWRVTIAAYPDAPLIQAARAAGHEVFEQRVRTDSAPWLVVPFMRWLGRNQVDLVFTNYDKDLRTMGLAAHLRGLPVVHSRECDVPLKNKASYRYFYASVADHVLVNSEATRKTTLDSVSWLSPDRVSILYKGIDLEPFATATPPRPSDGPTIFGFAGQLVPRKKVDLVLRALAALPNPAWRFRVAGEGPELAGLKTLADELNISERVDFLGYVTDIPHFMHSIDALVLPSLIEGFGYVLVEAAAARVPSVGFVASSVPEIVVDGTGLLIEPQPQSQQVERWSAALLQLMTDPVARRAMGQAAYERTLARFSEAIMLDTLENKLKQYLDASLTSLSSETHA